MFGAKNAYMTAFFDAIDSRNLQKQDSGSELKKPGRLGIEEMASDKPHDKW